MFWCRNGGGETAAAAAALAAAAVVVAAPRACAAASSATAAADISWDCSLNIDENEDVDDEVDRCSDDLRWFVFR